MQIDLMVNSFINDSRVSPRCIHQLGRQCPHDWLGITEGSTSYRTSPTATGPLRSSSPRSTSGTANSSRIWPGAWPRIPNRGTGSLLDNTLIV